MITPTNETLEDSLANLAGLHADDFRGVFKVQEAWARLIQSDPAVLEHLYARYLAILRQWLAQGYSATDRVEAYKFVLAFSSSRYLSMRRTEAWQLLREAHAEHIELIRQALVRPDELISARHTRTNTGHWGDIVESMLEMYCWHLPYGEQDAVVAEAAQLVPALYRTFPMQQGFMLPGLLMQHPHAVREAAGLLRFYALDRGNLQEGPMPSIALDLLGHYADKRDPAHVQAGAILAGALDDSAQWPDAVAGAFVERIILYPLGIETYTVEQAAAKLRASIENQRRILAEDRYEASMGISAQSARERDEQYLKDYEAELALIEGDFAQWNTRRRRKAVQRVAVSSLTRKALKAAAAKLPVGHRPTVQGLLDEAADYAARPKRFPMPKAADNRFKDFGLKLLVIEELMYRQKVLEPCFDIHEFAQEYEKREISVEADGYAIIPEAERYFRNLAVPDNLLAQVERLHQSSGLDGGPSFLDHLFPFWDPGVGDEPISVTVKAADDLALLPNLKRISGLENSRPGPKLLKALAARGIELLDEEGAE
ncbi:hypothetical protein BOTU111921_16535 [Bordetella tumbae]|uniref:DUF6892 domain-containing protein n=1 Tax=Bordetella tumbae TaxID=1649139 RepID=UPI0039EEF396